MSSGSNSSGQQSLHVVVIVLGDVGRSPRMQYHALSLLQAGHTVSLVGYEGEDIIPALKDFLLAGNSEQKFNLVLFRVPSPKIIQKITLIYFMWRILSLSIWLSWVLMVRVPKRPRINCLLVQNPPALPLLLIAYIFCSVQGLMGGNMRNNRPGLIIDWHNLGWSMLRPGSFQRVAQAYERAMAPLADGHLTVTKAMRDFLIDDIKIPVNSNISVLYDCPPDMFQPLSTEQQHEILMKLDRQLCEAVPKSWYASKDDQLQTLLTEQYGDGNNKQYRPRRERPALVTSSTSWTPDEDFGVLLDAIEEIDKQIRAENSSLRVLVVVTGKGPQKLYYEQKMSQMVLCNVAVQTLWLDPGDYPKLLACADLGVCLHTSTSGLDLPMKVLDLFGCQVPVCAVNFACLSELVQDGVNGRVFETSSQLAKQLWDLLQPLTSCPFSSCHSYGALEEYSSALREQKRWDDNWTENAWPVIVSAANGK